MNRVKRDYCSKGNHPKWRSWQAEYDMTSLSWKWLGEKCVFCNAWLSDTIGSGPPKQNGYIKRFMESKLSFSQKLHLFYHYKKNKAIDA